MKQSTHRLGWSGLVESFRGLAVGDALAPKSSYNHVVDNIVYGSHFYMPGARPVPHRGKLG